MVTAQENEAGLQARHETVMAILKRIEQLVEDADSLEMVQLAEAYAWVMSPNNGHG